MKKNLFLIILCFSVINSYATILSGQVGGMELDSTGNPFIIKESIIVAENKTLKIKPGCVFLFLPFTNLEVNGNIEVLGEHKNPVIFTSKNDRNYTDTYDTIAQPFDWNGIIISNKAKLVNLENFILSYSVFGIKSFRDTISIINGVFLQNGQFNVTINGKIQTVKENIPFTYQHMQQKNIATQNPDKPQQAKHHTPIKAAFFSTIVPGGGLYYAGAWKTGAAYTIGTIGAAVSAYFLGNKDPGKTCGECNGWKNGTAIQWKGCIEGEWTTETSTFNANTFYGQVAIREGWTETYGGKAEITKGKYTPNITLVIVGSILYLGNIIHAGVYTKVQTEKKKQILINTSCNMNEINLGITYSF
jgi:hypothetical protein